MYVHKDCYRNNKGKDLSGLVYQYDMPNVVIEEGDEIVCTRCTRRWKRTNKVTQLNKNTPPRYPVYLPDDL